MYFEFCNICEADTQHSHNGHCLECGYSAGQAAVMSHDAREVLRVHFSAEIRQDEKAAIVHRIAARLG